MFEKTRASLAQYLGVCLKTKSKAMSKAYADMDAPVYQATTRPVLLGLATDQMNMGNYAL